MRGKRIKIVRAGAVIVLLGGVLLCGAWGWQGRALETAVGTRTAQAADEQNSSDGVERQTAPPWTGSPLIFEEPNRDQTLRIPFVMQALKIERGAIVADIGAGGGWFSVRAARRVGSTGVVYAQEILPKFAQYIEQRARRENLTNIRTILGTTTDPKLPANALDSVVILNAYHEFGKPLLMLRKIRAAMKKGARLGFIERDSPELRREAQEAYAKTGKIKRRVDEKPDGVTLTDDHMLARDIVEREAASAGFRKVLAQTLSSSAARGDYYIVVVTRD